MSKIGLPWLLQDKNIFARSVSHILKFASAETTHHPYLCNNFIPTSCFPHLGVSISTFLRKHKVLHFFLIKVPLFSNPVIPLPSFLFSKHIFIVQGIKQYLYFSELSGIIIPASKNFLIYSISEFISRSYSVISFPLPWFTVIRTGVQKMSFPLPIPPSNISKHYSEKKKKDSMWLQNTNFSFEVFPLS